MPTMLRDRRISAIGLALLVIPVTGTGCVTRGAVASLEQRVRDLEQENFRLRKELAEAGVRRRIQQERVERGDEARPPTADQGFGEIVEDWAEGPGVIESEPITDTSRWTWAPSGGPGAAAGAGRSAEDLMRAAQASLDARDPEVAMAHFRDIVIHHGEGALADDAQFGIGECYFQMGRYDEAITEYRRVVDGYPFGDQVPYAFLKIGFAHLALEQRDAALDSFRTVSEAYPGTEAATVARQQIAHLSRP